jgi:hypothetical protein
MNKEDVLKAFEELDAADQQALRTAIAERAAAGCCGRGEMQQHMAAMMKMMQSSESPMECCKQMMGMCEEMMHKSPQEQDEAR